MKLAIQEDMLAGKTLLDKFATAQALGFQGIEFWGRGLPTRVPEIAEAIEKTGILAAAVNHGRQSRFIDADRAERERALAELRASVVSAVDIGAPAVLIVPHFGAPTVPDFTPYKSVIQLEYELLHNHLRTLSDYVYAIGVNLYIEPVNRYETHFLNTLADAVRARRKIKDHAHVKLTANLFHMALEETNIPQALRDAAKDIGHIHLADSNRRLPGQGLIDFAAIASALQDSQYDGWLTLECGQPGQNQEFARQYTAELPTCLDYLRRAGFTF